MLTTTLVLWTFGPWELFRVVAECDVSRCQPPDWDDQHTRIACRVFGFPTVHGHFRLPKAAYARLTGLQIK